MAGVDFNVGVNSQIPVLLGQILQTRTAAISMADALISKQRGADAAATAVSQNASARAGRAQADIAALNTAFSGSVQETIAQVNQLSGVSLDTAGAQEAVLQGPATRGAGAIGEQFQASLEKVKILTREGELAVQRAQSIVAVAQEAAGLQQESTALLQRQDIITRSIFEISSGIRKERETELNVRQRVAEELARMPEFLLFLQSEEDIILQTLIEQETTRQRQMVVTEDIARQIGLSSEDIASIERGITLEKERQAKAARDQVDAAIQQLGVLDQLGKKEERRIQQQQNQLETFQQRFVRESFRPTGRVPRNQAARALEVQAQALAGKSVQVKTEEGFVTRKLTEEEGRLIVSRGAGVVALKAHNKEYVVANGLLRKNRAHLINNSIGLFVLSITITQTVGAMEQMVRTIAKSNEGMKVLGVSVEGAADFLQELNQVIRFSLGPIQVYTAIVQLAAASNREFLKTGLPMLLLLAEMGIVLKAFTAESKGARIAFGLLGTAVGLTGVSIAGYNLHNEIASIKARNATLATAGLTSAKVGETFATLGTTSAKSAEIVASRGLTGAQTSEAISTGALIAAKTGLFGIESGLLTLKTFGLGAIVALSALGLIASVIATVRALTSFQTDPGSFKIVGRSGVAQVHEGEVIGRPSAAAIGDRGFFRTENQSPVNIFVSGNLTSDVAKGLRKRTRALQIGQS